MSWIVRVQDPVTGSDRIKEFDNDQEDEAYFYAYRFPSWEVYHS